MLKQNPIRSYEWIIVTLKIRWALSAYIMDV